MSTFIDGSAFPFIENHRVNGQAVLPIVLVIEWFMRLGRSIVPGLKPIALTDIQVLKGIVLEDYPDRQWFEIEACSIHANGNLKIAVELKCAEGMLRYRAELELGRDLHMAAPFVYKKNGNGSTDWPYAVGEIYEGRLFHGPDFQAVCELESYSETGGTGIVQGIGQMGWPSGPWSTNPLALDGGIQLGILWGMARTDLAFLPQRIEAYIPHFDAEPPSGPFRCGFTSRQTETRKTESDMTFATMHGEVVGELRGLELYGIENKAGKAAS